MNSIKVILFLIIFIVNVKADNFIKKSEVSCPKTITYYFFDACESVEGSGNCIAVDVDFDCRWSSLEDNKIVENAALKAQFQAQDAVAEADQLAMITALNAINCGKVVKARLLIQNATKSLTDNQKLTILSTYANIDGLLSAGSLNTARTKILEVVADGVMITDADKTALIAELDKCN